MACDVSPVAMFIFLLTLHSDLRILCPEIESAPASHRNGFEEHIFGVDTPGALGVVQPHHPVPGGGVEEEVVPSQLNPDRSSID